MADIEQGIKYTIEADASKAQQTLKTVSQQAAENGQAIENAMSGVNAVTSALQGNFTNAIASVARMTRAVGGLGAAIAKMTGWAAIVGAVVGVFKHFRDAAEEAKEKLEAIRQVRFEEHLKALKEAQSGLADEIARTVAEIDKQLDADTRHLDIIKEKTKAQIELNRQIALEGRSAEEKERINASANAQLAQTDRDAASAKLAAQIAAQANKTDALYALRERQSQLADTNYEEYQSAFGEESRLFNAAREEYLKRAIAKALDKRENVDIASDGAARERFAQNFRDAFIRRGSNSEAFRAELLENADYQKALKRTLSLREAYHGAQGGLERLDSAISDSEAKEKELAQQREIDEAKKKAAVQAERNIQVELAQVRLEEGRKEARKLSLSDATQTYMAANERQKGAQERLAAAQASVQRAWGWYRDKDSMKRQLDEEKANAEAERQFEKDFDKLTFRRDWRTAKNLSVDQEAVRRVGLAREEEAAAQKAATETAENTARAAEALEDIRKAMTEEA